MTYNKYINTDKICKVIFDVFSHLMEDLCRIWGVGGISAVILLWVKTLPLAPSSCLNESCVDANLKFVLKGLLRTIIRRL